MSPKESDRWFVYSEGKDSRLIDLGTLVFDYANPGDLEPYRHPQLSALEQDVWSVTNELHQAWLKYSRTQQMELSGGIIDLAELTTFHESQRGSSVVADKAFRTELLSPQKFLNEMILRSKEGTLWLSSRLSIARSMKILRNMTLQVPKIWMLTGVLKLHDARSVYHDARTRRNETTAALPLDALTGIPMILQLPAGARFSVGSGHEVSFGNTLRGSKVWAAKFQRLDVKWQLEISDGQAALNEVKLLNVHSTTTYKGEAEVALLNVTEDNEGDKSQEDLFDAVYWEAFDKELAIVKEQLE